jgi:dTDP-glucose 4,6-dehydratase
MGVLIVTGGMGFIGSNFLSGLVQNLYLKTVTKIRVIDSLTYASSIENSSDWLHDPRIEFFHTDICDFGSLRELCAGASAIIHFAAESHVDNSIKEPHKFLSTNILGTQNVIDVALENDSKLLIVSTDEVYGSLTNGFANESALLNPSSPYSASKAAADLLGIAAHKTFGAKVIITRSANNYGCRQHNEKFIPTVIQCLHKGKKIPVYGNGANVRNWIHALDHCRAIALALENGEVGSVYNIGSDEYFTNIEIIDAILTKMELTSTRKSYIEFVEDRKGHDFRYAVDFKKIQNELNWFPTANLHDTLSEMINWYGERL